MALYRITVTAEAKDGPDPRYPRLNRDLVVSWHVEAAGDDAIIRIAERVRSAMASHDELKGARIQSIRILEVDQHDAQHL